MQLKNVNRAIAMAMSGLMLVSSTPITANAKTAQANNTQTNATNETVVYSDDAYAPTPYEPETTAEQCSTEVYEPNTNLVMAPAVISEKDGKSISELISGTRRPSTIIRSLSKNMTVLDNGEKISAKEFVTRANKKALVGFEIKTMTVAKEFAKYVKENNLADIMVIADDPDILLTACNRMPGVHGMLDCKNFKGETQEDIFEMVKKTNESNSRILVLPQELATEENIQYIQNRAVTVWVRAAKEQFTNVILNGAEGILTEDYNSAYDVMESFNEGTPVLTRNTIITAHRGFHGNAPEPAPENSERAAELSVQYGADTIECDIYLSQDGEVIINHDDTTGRLMNKDLDVRESTLEELQELVFNENAQEGDKLPTLEELFVAGDKVDPEDDIIHVIEIKTVDPDVIEPMIDVIKENNMEDRVVFISFSDEQLELVRQMMPQVAAGELNAVISAEDDVPTALAKLYNRMDEYGYFYNCNYKSQSEAVTKAARFRGIYVHPWTVNDQAEFEKEYINNYHGITTNRTDFAKDYLNKVTTGSDTYTLYAQDANGVAIDAKAYTRMNTQIEGANIIMKQLSGPAVKYENGVCTAEETGTAVVVFGSTYTLPTIGQSYAVYGKPVTLNIKSNAENPSGYDAEIFEPDTSLTMPAAVISENDGKSVKELISAKRRPSTIIRTVSQNLTVTDNNEEISLEEYVARVDKKALAGFKIESMEVATAFANYVKEKKLVDIMVMAEEPEILLAACNRMTGVHGMLDCKNFSGSTKEEIFQMVSKTNEANSRILVLPQELATEENIQYIQNRAVTVWVRAEKDQFLNMVLNGAEGILTNDSEGAYDVIESFDEGTPVLTRNTIITAHRGFHGDAPEPAPENSERAAKLSVQYGADTIECDIYLSKDGQVIINHDDTTGRLMNENVDVRETTLEELQKLTFNKNAQEGDKLPTLKELFIAADEVDPEDDIIHVIEIKTVDPNVIQPMIDVIKEMHMEDRVVFISFSDAQLELVRQMMPQVAAGELNSVISSKDNVPTALAKLCNRMDAYGYFYNCSYGAQSEEVVKAARFRGIYVHPWTVNNQEIFETEYINNYHGITTNRTDFAKDYLNKVETGKTTYTLQAQNENGVAVDVKAYTRMNAEIEDADIVMKQISGKKVRYDDGICYAEEAGEAVVLFGANYTLPATGKTYTVYGKPVTLHIDKSESLKNAEAANTAAQAALKSAELARDKALEAQNKTETAQIAQNDSFAEVAVTIKKVTAKKAKQIQLSWKQAKDAEGYVVEYATKSGFGGKKVITIKGGKTTAKKIKKLTSGKKYYVRIKAYKTVNGKMVYSKNSGVKTIRVK